MRPSCSKRGGPKEKWFGTSRGGRSWTRRGRAVLSPRRPFLEAYIFCYHYGRELLEPGMCGPGRDAFVRRLLTEQVTSSELRS